MAGQPKKHTLAKQIREDGGDRIIWAEIVAGEKLKTIAESYGVNYQALLQWVHAGGEKREKAYAQAKADSADALVDEARDVLDERVREPMDVSRAKNRSDMLRWLAGKRDRDQYGDGPQIAIGVNLDLGQLHLDALRTRGRMADAPEPIEIPAEVISEEPA